MRRTVVVCACAAGVGVGATGALAGKEDDGYAPAIEALTPVVDEQLVPPGGRPSERQQDRYLELHRKAAEIGDGPGLNILSHGMKEGDGDFRLASARDVKRSTRILERMTGPAVATTGAGADTGARSGASQTTGRGQLDSIAACESGGDPSAVGGGGAYRGKYQFSRETWASVGGSGDPAAAPEAVQDRRAAQLLARAGASHWPGCGG